MPELRKDPIVGRWVIISTERAKKPDHFSAHEHEITSENNCPFCNGKEKETPSEIYAIRPENSPSNTPGWDLRVIPSIAPFLRIEGDIERRGKGLYDVTTGLGAHEVIVETSQHVANMADLTEDQIVNVLSSYVSRISDLERDIRFKYALVFKNYGWQAGGGKVQHSRSQIIATPINPKRVKEELVGAHEYYNYHDRCIFCDLIKQDLASKERLVLDLDGFVAITPFASRFPFETWILPKKHSCDFVNLSMSDRAALALVMKKVLSKLKIGLNDPPYNYVLHTAPFRRAKPGYWKTIDQDYHWHIEIMPRLTQVAGFEWGTGFYICPLPPEDGAKFLREIKV